GAGNPPCQAVVVVWATTEAVDGEGRSVVRAIVAPADTEGVQTPEIHRKISLRASSTGEIVLDNVRLPADAMLPEAEGLKGPLSCLSEARYGIVFGVTGAARDSLLSALEYTGTRVQFDRPLSSFQITQQKLAKA